MRKYKHTFSIDRAKWLNCASVSVWDAASMLRDEKGRMCCVGFFAKSLAVRGITNRFTLGSSADDRLAPNKTRILDDRTLDRLYSCNDNHAAPKARENRIAKLFADAGVKVTFRGKAPKAP